MISTIAIKEENGYVKGVIMHLTPSDYLVVAKALRILEMDEGVHEIDRQTARELLGMMDKEF